MASSFSSNLEGHLINGMNIPYVALKNLKRKIGRAWLLVAIVAVVSCTLFSATLFLKSINNAIVKAGDDAAPDRAAVRIDRSVGEVKAPAPDVVVGTVRKQLSGMVKAIATVGMVLWLIVLLIMAFAFYMIVNERRREIGLLRAMGANRGHIASIFLTEAAYLSAAGGAAGVVLGYGVLFSFRSLRLHYLGLPSLFPGAGELAVLTAGALLMSLATGLAAALLPSLAVLTVEPYEAIRSAE